MSYPSPGIATTDVNVVAEAVYVNSLFYDCLSLMVVRLGYCPCDGLLRNFVSLSFVLSYVR